jgi:hypothetical protein
LGKHAGGRPPIDLRTDPDRFAVAQLEMQHIVCRMTGKKFVEWHAAQLVAALYGDFDLSKGVYHGHKVSVPAGSSLRKEPTNNNLRNGFIEVTLKSPHNPAATGFKFRQRADRLRKKRQRHTGVNDDNGRWLENMAIAWMCVLRPELVATRFSCNPANLCWFLAVLAGEQAFAAGTLLPGFNAARSP